MRKTHNFNQLTRNIYNLKELLLPVIRQTGDYSDDDKIRIRTFRVMAHAEIENYLENNCVEIVDYNLNNPSARMNACVLRSLQESISYTEKVFSTKSTQNQIVGIYKKAIEKNHGIKEENIYLLFKPLGIDIEKLDPLILTSLSDYGSKRGFFAHNSISKNPQLASMQIVYDPSIEFNEIKSILKLLKKLDFVCKGYIS